MRHDHILAFNEQMEVARNQTEQTLSVLRSQHQQLEQVVSVATQTMQLIEGQIEQLDRLQEVVGQMAVVEGTSPDGNERNKLSVALRAVETAERAEASSNH